MNDQAGRQIARLEKPAPTPDEIAFLAGPKCGDCIHWHQEPRQQVHVNEAAIAHLPTADQKRVREAARLQNSGSLLNEERRGECRRELLTIPLMQQTPNGAQFAGSTSYYPGGIEAAFRACGHYTPRLPLPVPDDF